jgi:hypothetical protein
LRDRRLNQDEGLRVARSLHDIARKPWWTIDARGQKAERIFGQIRAAIKVHRIDLVMVDYVQAMRLGHHGMRGVDRIGEIGRALTDTIKSQDGVALWMVSQSTPEKGREDDVYSARGNKDLAVEAEVVLIGEWYEQAARGEGRKRKIVCGKVKEGPAGREFEAPWDNDSANFVADVDEQLTLDMEEY